jgi:hypothetical protein
LPEITSNDGLVLLIIATVAFYWYAIVIKPKRTERIMQAERMDRLEAQGFNHANWDSDAGVYRNKWDVDRTINKL